MADIKSWREDKSKDMIIHAAGWQRGNPNKGGKWKELKWKRAYPKFPSGAGHVVNRNLAEWIVGHGDSLVEYQGEDTSIGIWLDQASFSAKFEKNRIFTAHGGNCFEPGKHVVGHNIPNAKMRQCWQRTEVAYHKRI